MLVGLIAVPCVIDASMSNGTERTPWGCGHQGTLPEPSMVMMMMPLTLEFSSGLGRCVFVWNLMVRLYTPCSVVCTYRRTSILLHQSVASSTYRCCPAGCPESPPRRQRPTGHPTRTPRRCAADRFPGFSPATLAVDHCVEEKKKGGGKYYKYQTITTDH